MNRTELELLHNKIKSISASEFEDWLEQMEVMYADNSKDYGHGYDDGYEEGYSNGIQEGEIR